MSRILSLKVDEVSIDEAQANICVDAKELLEDASGISLNGLQCTKAENNVEWEKEDMCLLNGNFQELLNGNFGDMCLFLCTLHS